MKQLQLVLGLILGIVSVGCQTEQQSINHNSAVPTVSTLGEIKQNEDKISYGKNGLPPLDDKLLDFYKNAYEFYQKYYMCDFQVDYDKVKVVSELTYYQVNEEEFSTLEELKDHIKFYFTGMTLNDILLEINYYFIEENGILYALDFREHRYVGQLIDKAEENARTQGEAFVYISTGESGLYEKYGYSFYKMMKDLGGEDSRVYRKAICS